jgi:hypothetical protein
LSRWTVFDTKYPYVRSTLAMRWSEEMLLTLLHTTTSPYLQQLNLDRSSPSELVLPLLRSNLSSLRVLEFEYIPDITLEDGTNLADCAFLRQMHQLEEVRLKFSLDYPLTPIFAESLASCHQLTSLTIRHAVIESGVLTTAFAGLTRLQTVCFTPVSLRSLSAFSSSPSLARSLTRVALYLLDPIAWSDDETRH